MRRWLLERARTWVSALELVTRPDLDAFTRTLTERLTIMADQITDVLNGVADDLGNKLAPAIDALVDERNALATRNAELEGTEVAQSAAAGRVKGAFDDIAGRFTSAPEVPDVEPLPEPAQPEAPSPDPSPAGEGPATPVEPEQGAPVQDGEQQV